MAGISVKLPEDEEGDLTKRVVVSLLVGVVLLGILAFVLRDRTIRAPNEPCLPVVKELAPDLPVRKKLPPELKVRLLKVRLKEGGNRPYNRR